MKKYFILNDRNDVSKGYTEVSEAEIRKYVSEFSDGKAYFINLGYAVMETNYEHYHNFYKDKERQRYLKKLDYQNNLFSYDAVDSDDFQGADIVCDTSEHFEEVIARKLLIDKFPECFSMLNDEEKALIRQIYIKNMSEREIAKLQCVSHTAIQNRHKRILNNLKKYF